MDSYMASNGSWFMVTWTIILSARVVKWRLRATSHTWSRTLKCSVKSYVTGPSTNAISMNLNSCRSSRMIQYNKSTVVSIWSAKVSQFSWLSLPPKSGFWKYSKWPWNMIHSMLCRTPCTTLYIHLAFTYSLRWFPTRRVKQPLTGSTFSTNESE